MFIWKYWRDCNKYRQFLRLIYILGAFCNFPDLLELTSVHRKWLPCLWFKLFLIWWAGNIIIAKYPHEYFMYSFSWVFYPSSLMSIKNRLHYCFSRNVKAHYCFTFFPFYYVNFLVINMCLWQREILLRSFYLRLLYHLLKPS